MPVSDRAADAEPRPASPRRGRGGLAALMAILAAFVVVYWRAPSQGFYSDDFVFLKFARDFDWWWFADQAFTFGGADDDWVYWRPGVHLGTAGLYRLFALDASAWLTLAALLHLLATLFGYALARAARAPAWAAALGAVFVLVAPAAQETVSWMCTAYGVIPATLCALGSGWCLLRFEETGTRWRYALALLLAALALAWKELAYHLVPFAFGAVLAQRGSLRWPAWRDAALRALPLAAMVVLHFAMLNRVPAASGSGRGPVAHLLATQAEYLRNALGVPGGDAVVLGTGAALLLAGLLVRGAPRVRVLAWWAAVATAPYAAKIYADRHAYVLLLTLGAALPAVGARIAGKRGWAQVLVGVLLVALIGQGAWRLPGAQERQRANGRFCREVLSWSLQQGLHDYDHLCPDFIPVALEHGWGEMLALHTGRAEGPGVWPSTTLAFPPFQVLLLGDLPPDTERAAFLRFDPETRSYEVVPRAAMFAGKVPVPLLCLVDEYELAPNERAALVRATSGEVALRERVILETPLPAELAARIDDLPGSPGRIVHYDGFPEIRVRLDVERPGLLVVSVPRALAAARGGLQVEVDGAPVRPLPANGMFFAVPLPAGARRARIVVPQ